MNRQALVREIVDPAAPPRATRLAGLSGLDGDDRDEFGRLFAQLPAERRLNLAEQLLALAEDNPTLDFAAVFRLLLDDDDAALRRLAIDGLWEDDDRALIEPLIRLLESDPDTGVRGTAALSLGRFVLLNEFEEMRPRDAERVLHALGDAFEDFGQAVEVRARTIEALGACSGPWAAALIRRAFDDDEEPLKLGAIAAMGRSSNVLWLPEVLETMDSDDAARRFEAAGAAGQIGDEDAVPALTDLMDDANPEVQEAAFTALGAIGGDLAVEALQERLRESTGPATELIRSALVEAQGGVSFVPFGDEGEEETDLDEQIAARLESDDL